MRAKPATSSSGSGCSIGIGYAHNAIGEVRLRMGDLDGAAEAFERAYEYGHDAQPGFVPASSSPAARSPRRVARSTAPWVRPPVRTGRATRRRGRASYPPWSRSRSPTATWRRPVGPSMSSTSSRWPSSARMFEAGALSARGDLLLHEDKAAEASPLFGRSWRLWQQTDLPYEAARARLRYAEALTAEGDLTAARRDLLAARGVFERLGARLDLDRVDALLGDERPASGPSAQRATKTFMFTDIVTSTDLVGLIGDDAWSELLRWHDRELRAAFAAHGGEEVNHTGDGFFVAFERAIDGIECAVDIQRRLARHRREHGFAPWVRIGLHAADATREGRDYRGQGVHVAARVGAAAGSEEILVTATVLDGIGPGRFPLSEARSLTLKGVREPVEVRSVAWR